MGAAATGIIPDSMSDDRQITLLLDDAYQGRPGALDDLARLVYGDVERIARRAEELSREHPEHRVAFERYLDRERKESAFIEDHLTCATWLLRRN